MTFDFRGCGREFIINFFLNVAFSTVMFSLATSKVSQGLHSTFFSLLPFFSLFITEEITLVKGFCSVLFSVSIKSTGMSEFSCFML